MLNRLLNLWLNIVVSILVLWVLPIKHAGPSSWGLEFKQYIKITAVVGSILCCLEYILYRYILVKELNCTFFFCELCSQIFL